MKEKTRMTRQGIRDLNYYGPKRPTAAAGTVASKSVEDATTAPTTPVVPQVVATTVGQEETAAVSKS